MKHWQPVYGIGLALLLPLALAAADAAAPPRVFQSDGRDLARVKRQAAANAAAADALKALRVRADAALKAGPYSVVHARPVPPPSGDVHDYVSLAPYWWPDPARPDGLPYVRRDGRVNPERNKYDSPLLKRMCDAVGTLALASYLTGEERYAAHAARLLRAWFLDPATRMNPNLNFGQFIPGRNDGRGNGIIDTVGLLTVVDAAGLLHGTKAWTAADQAGLEGWFRRYLDWLRTSKIGREEAASANNHGSWYDAQVASYALFVGDRDGARRVVEAAKTKRIARQIEPDGSQPLELKRTKSFGYSVVNLRALFALATLGEPLGVDLWRYRTADGRGIRQALDYLVPYATGSKRWQREQIGGMPTAAMAQLLRRAANAYGDRAYEEALGRLPRGAERGTMDLLYPKRP